MIVVFVLPGSSSERSHTSGHYTEKDTDGHPGPATPIRVHPLSDTGRTSTRTIPTLPVQTVLRRTLHLFTVPLNGDAMTMTDPILRREFYEQLIDQGMDEFSAEILTAEAAEDGAFDE